MTLNILPDDQGRHCRGKSAWPDDLLSGLVVGLFALDFLLDEAEGRLNYRLIEIESE